MNALTEARLTATPEPTADAPEYGEIRLRNSLLSKAAYWREGDLHIFRSIEYDVIAADEDRDAAVRVFVEKTQDYARFIADLEGDPTADDLQTALLIMSRIVNSYEGYFTPKLFLVRLVRRVRNEAAQAWHRAPAART